MITTLSHWPTLLCITSYSRSEAERFRRILDNIISITAS